MKLAGKFEFSVRVLLYLGIVISMMAMIFRAEADNHASIINMLRSPHMQASVIIAAIFCIIIIVVEFQIRQQHRLTGFLMNVLENSDLSILLIDQELKISYANKVFCEKARVSRKKAVGEKCHRISHHSEKPCYEEGESCPVKEVFLTGTSKTGVHTHFDSAGKRCQFEIKAYPSRNLFGKVTRVMEVISDVTERASLRKQLFHAQKMEAVGILAGGIAHDFNNVLAAILGSAEIIKMNARLTADETEDLKQIITSSQKAAELVKNLLAFSRKQVLDPKQVELNNLIGSANMTLRRVCREDISFRMEFSPAKLFILADSLQIEQILINLVSNARDAMPRGGKLLLKTESVDIDGEFYNRYGFGRPGKYAVISVLDNGTGIDEETKARIFEPFFSTKTLGRGTGLGLAMVYSIVKQHNGYIDVKSEPEKGTCFSIYLPLIQPKTLIEEKKATVRVLRGSEIILLAEDDEDTLRTTKRILESGGYKVIAAKNGNEAVSEFIKHEDEIQLLVSDLVMPGLSGIDVWETIRGEKDIGAVFISGYEEGILREKGVKEKEISFIRKPFLPEDLLKQIRSVLDQG